MHTIIRKENKMYENQMYKSVIGTDAKTEASHEHTQKVLQLTISDIMELCNENLISNDLVDDLYYYLLDNEAIRKRLK